jgi:hypothetical protein
MNVKKRNDILFAGIIVGTMLCIVGTYGLVSAELNSIAGWIMLSIGLIINISCGLEK